MIDTQSIRLRWELDGSKRDERGQRLFAASEASAAVVELIAATTTKTGLRVECALDQRTYEKGIKITDAEMEALDIRRDTFHPEWNLPSTRGQDPRNVSSYFCGSPKLADFRVQRLDVDLRRRRFAARTGTKYIGSPVLQLLLPRSDLARVNIELISQLCNRPLTLDGSQGHLRLECR